MTQVALTRQRDAVAIGTAIEYSQMRQRPAPAHCVVRGPKSSGHTTEIVGTTREYRIGTPEMEGKGPTGLYQAPRPVCQQTTKAVEVILTEMVEKALEIQEVHLPEDGTPYC